MRPRRRHLGVGHHLKTAVFGWNTRRPDRPMDRSCTRIFYSASIIWGAVAPARFFAGKYVWLYGGFVLGAVVPILTWIGHKRYPGTNCTR